MYKIKLNFLLVIILPLICFNSMEAQIIPGLFNNTFKEINVTEKSVFSGEVELKSGLWLNGYARFSQDISALGKLNVAGNVVFDNSLNLGESLNVNGSVRFTGMLFDTAFSATSFIGSNQTGELLRIGEEQLSKLLTPIILPPPSNCLTQPSGNSLSSWTYDINRIVVDDCSKENVKVGIGTLEPKEKLHVTGGIQARALHIRRNTATSLAPEISAELGGLLLIGGHPNGVQNLDRYMILGYDNVRKINFIESNSDANASLYLNPSNSGSVLVGSQDAYADFNVFGNNNINGNLNVLGDGNVSKRLIVGQSNLPSFAQLVVDAPEEESAFLVRQGGDEKFKIASDGRAYARGLSVRISNFPDYVFEEDYEQLSLEEIEKYIEKHKRLPKMPSAVDVEKNGANVEELLKLLVEKVEELTLEMIELKKENVQLKEYIDK